MVSEGGGGGVECLSNRDLCQGVCHAIGWSTAINVPLLTSV